MLDFLGNLVSGGLNYLTGRRAQDLEQQRNAENIALQKQFAQQGIQWKVADARAAGVHPMFALGANTVSFAPQSLGDVGTEAMSRAGQDIGRAISSTQSLSTREKNYTAAAQALALEKGGLENELLKSQILREKRALMPGGPAAAVSQLVPGQASSVVVPKSDKFEDRPRLAVGGRELVTDPGTSNAEDFEKRYGEMSDWFYGPQVWMRDHNSRMRSDQFARELLGRKDIPLWYRRYLERGRRFLGTGN